MSGKRTGNCDVLFAIANMQMETPHLLKWYTGNGVKWYKNLSLNQKINIKDAFVLLTGVDFQKVGVLLSLRDRIELMYSKLIKEGIIQERSK
jgi:hypothetical protein